MSLAVCLVAYSAAVAVLGPRALLAMTANGAVPRLGVTVWLLSMGSVLAAWVVAVAAGVLEIASSWDDLDRVLTGCMAALRLVAVGGYGPAVQVVLLLLAAVSVAALAVGLARLATSVRGTTRRTRAHAQAARLAAAGSPPGPNGALVIDSAQPAVYCLAGRPDTLVITKGALDALTEEQLAAVLAHEHAHLAGRHHAVLAMTTALGRILGSVRLFADGAADVARLLEMCADDAASRRHRRETVADALVALALPPSGRPYATPALGLGAARVGVAQRVERLLFPPAAAPARAGLTAVLATVLLGPAAMAAMTTLVPVFCSP